MNIRAEIMNGNGRSRPDLFAHPAPHEYDYTPVLAALRQCRQRVVDLMGHTGPRNPMYVEAESLIAYIDAVARLTRVPDGMTFVRGEETPGN